MCIRDSLEERRLRAAQADGGGVEAARGDVLDAPAQRCERGPVPGLEPLRPQAERLLEVAPRRFERAGGVDVPDEAVAHRRIGAEPQERVAAAGGDGAGVAGVDRDGAAEGAPALPAERPPDGRVGAVSYTHLT